MNKFIKNIVFLFLILSIVISAQTFAAKKTQQKHKSTSSKKISKNITKNKSKFLHKKNATKKSISVKKSLKSSKGAKNKGKFIKTSKNKIQVKKVKYPAIQIGKEINLTNGLTYQNIFIGNGYTRFSAHVLLSDISKDHNLVVLKGNDKIDELERLHDMLFRNDSLYQTKIYGAVNANFWRAYSNLPIGPTIKDGEIIEMKSYKEWSSALWDDEKLIIDNFVIHGIVQNNFNEWLEISCVNRRKDSSGVVLYNRFSGDTIPKVTLNNYDLSLLQVKKDIFKEAIMDSVEIDSTELELDLKKLQQEIYESKKFAQIEYSVPKIKLIPLDKPSLNVDMRYVIVGYDTNEIVRPKNGIVLSLGKDYNRNNFRFKIGDTVFISFNTTTHSNYHFKNGICGTPRLIRNGHASHEALKEGSTGKRFIYKPLPRTAIGVDKSGSKVFLVAIEPTSSSEGIIGANLTNLANIMKKLGCYNAINLDGGGSTVMVVNGNNVTRKGRPDYSRKISVGVGFNSKTKSLTN